jgi:hypothetical protein
VRRGRSRAALEGEHHAGESLVELGRGDVSPAARRIVQENAPFAHSLYDDEVVEVHEGDRGHRQLGQLARLLAEAARFQAVRARCPQQPARLAAVAAHAAIHAHLLERDVAAVEGEHHRERGRAALHAFQLQDRGRAPHRGLRQRRCGRPGRFSGVQRACSSHAEKAATRARSTTSTTSSGRG